MKILRLLLTFILISYSSLVEAHSVQVQYCVSCDGDLRIWIEHWHGAEDPSNTTMTINLDVNGTVTTQTSAPGGGVQNTASGALPGCSTPIIYGTGCPGQENTYNDWVYYDFVGIPQNVPITFTVVSGNTVFTTDGCNMFPLAVPFQIDGVGIETDQDLCTGIITSSINFPPGATWTNDNPSIGIPAAGTGPIPAFNPIGPVGTVANITYVNGCGSGDFTYTIQDVPSPSYTIDGSANETCIGFPFSFTDNSVIDPPNTIDGWDWDFGDGLGLNSAEQNPSYIYQTPGSYTVTFTAISDAGCGGSTTFDVVVNPSPTADFTTIEVCPNTPTPFTDISSVTNATIINWAWDILNDGTDEYTAQNPTHIFAAGGSYPVLLTVESDDGCFGSVINNVDVAHFPVVDMLSDSACFGTPSTTVDLSTVTNSTITGWNWTFEDGSTSTNVNGVHTYPATGNFSVQLEAFSAFGCSTIGTGNVYVRLLPIPDFNITEACFYDPVTTQNLSTVDMGTLSYVWDFGDGSATDANIEPNHNYSASGIYQVNLTAESSFTCVYDTTFSVNVYDKPSSSFTVLNTCVNNNSLFIDNSFIPNVINNDLINDWQWNMDDFGDDLYSVQNPEHPFHSEGIHNTTLIVTTEFGCKDTVELDASVWPIPLLDFDFNHLCLNDVTSFTDQSSISNTFTANSIISHAWDFGDGNGGFGPNPNHSYISFGNFNVHLTATSDHGCVNDKFENVYIRPLPNPNFHIDTICESTPTTEFVDLTTIPDGSIDQWSWDFDNGTTSNIQSPSATFSTFGTYQVELTTISAFGCINSITKPVYVFQNPIVQFTSDETVICDPGNVFFTDLSSPPVSAIDTWFWDFHNGTTSTVSNPTVAYNITGTEPIDFDVKLIVTNTYGCKDSILVEDYIRVVPTPEALFSYSPTELTVTDPETQFLNRSINSDEYLWSFGDNTANSTLENPQHLFPGLFPGSYNIQLIAYNYDQLCTDTAWATVIVQDVILFYVPNAFTPDSDQYNQTWQPVFTSGFDPFDFHLMIFNRWGEVIWESYDASAGWDGIYSSKGELVNDGVYVWVLEFKESLTDKRHKHNGFVTILK
jgi:gliding motility-associated-like protein